MYCSRDCRNIEEKNIILSECVHYRNLSLRLSGAVKFLLLYCHKSPIKNVAIVPRIKSKPITMGDKNSKGILDFPKKIVQNTLASSSGAGGGTRTPTPSLAADFESATSTNSITPANIICIIHDIALLGKYKFIYDLQQKCQGLNTEKSKIFICALFIQFHPLNPRLLSKLHQHPPDIPSIKDAIHPSLDLQHTVLRYLSDICPLWDLPPNHAVSVLVAPSSKCAVWMAIVCAGPLPIPSHSLFHLAVSNKARSALCRCSNCSRLAGATLSNFWRTGLYF